MEAPAFPPGTVSALLDSDLVTAPTRFAFRARLHPKETSRFFDDHAFATLQAACARLIPQSVQTRPVDLAAVLGARMADGESDGWRYAAMPRDAVMHETGLVGLDQTAQTMFGQNFVALAGSAQDAVLGAVQSGRAADAVWTEIEPACYFEELLAQLVDIYYAHPNALDAIGYAGMADARGWRAIGLDERDANEPVPVSALEGAA